ncbi:MAG: MATE family efflux transporter [Erysipelotrichaceae bacterium]
MLKKIIQDKVFLSTLLTLAIPITLQNFITSSLNLVDNVMIGRLGETSIAAVGLANQYFFVFLLCIAGINAGANIFMAQYWGKDDVPSIKKILGIDLSVGLIASLFFGGVALFFPTQIMSILSKDPEVIALGATYMRIVAFSVVCTNVTQGFSSGLRSINKPMAPMYASLLGVCSNAFLNWIFIFGNLGVPAMGVAGAALATSIARVIEMSYVLWEVYGKPCLISSSLKELTSFSMRDVKAYFNVSTSAILNELVWALGMTAFSIAYAMISTEAVATMQIATTLNNMFMVLCIGLGVSSSIMVGNKIGSNEESVAIDYGKKFAFLSPILGIIFGALIWISAPAIVSIFNVSSTTIDATITVLRIMALFAPLRFFTCVMIIGIFRGGGDTLYTMLLQLGTIWLYAVPLAFIAAAVLNFSVTTVFFLICTEEIVKIGFIFQRNRSGKWLHNVVNEPTLTPDLAYEA